MTSTRALARVLLGYSDGDLLNNVQRYKTWAESVITTLKANNEEAIREHESIYGRLTAALAKVEELTKDKEIVDHLETQDVWVGITGEFDITPRITCGKSYGQTVRAAITDAIKQEKKYEKPN